MRIHCESSYHIYFKFQNAAVKRKSSVLADSKVNYLDSVGRRQTAQTLDPLEGKKVKKEQRTKAFLNLTVCHERKRRKYKRIAWQYTGFCFCDNLPIAKVRYLSSRWACRLSLRVPHASTELRAELVQQFPAFQPVSARKVPCYTNGYGPLYSPLRADPFTPGQWVVGLRVGYPFFLLIFGRAPWPFQRLFWSSRCSE